MPEVPLLAAPTVAEVATRLGAEHLARPVGVGRPRPREVTRVIVGAMGLAAVPANASARATW